MKQHKTHKTGHNNNIYKSTNTLQKHTQETNNANNAQEKSKKRKSAKVKQTM